MKSNTIGLLLNCLLVPGAYAALAAVAAFWGAISTHTFFLLVLLWVVPALVSGFVKWLDVWVYPGPKVGVFGVGWGVEKFVGYAVVVHVATLGLNAVVYLSQPPLTDAERSQEIAEYQRNESNTRAELSGGGRPPSSPENTTPSTKNPTTSPPGETARPTLNGWRAISVLPLWVWAIHSPRRRGENSSGYVLPDPSTR